jgi:hypothetical protein
MNSKLSKKNSSEQSLPLWVRKLSHPRGEIAQRQLFRISQFSQKLSFKKKLKKLGMKDRYICDILAQERILKIQYTIYGDFLKKVRKLSHKYQNDNNSAKRNFDTF